MSDSCELVALGTLRIGVSSYSEKSAANDRLLPANRPGEQKTGQETRFILYKLILFFKAFLH